MLTVVIPAYNEEKNIERASSAISGVLSDANISYELLFVDDGSKDSTWEEIQKQHNNNANVKGIKFSRNFGKESAIFAGLTEAKGDCVAVIDCDLQHPHEKLVDMYRLWENGYEIVEGIKTSRGKESGLHSLAANCFYEAISRSTGLNLRRASDYKLLDRKAVNVLMNMPEKNAFFRALSTWVGFNTTQIEYDVREREVGKTKWSTKDLMKYAVDNITGFTSAPMHLVTILGIILFVISFILSAITIYQKIVGKALEGFTTVIIMQGFTSSIIMISLGIIGYYISKIYYEIKGRPRYIVQKRT